MSSIVAISTPYGSGGIAVIRVSGPDAVEIVSRAWRGADLLSVASHTAHLGKILDDDGSVLDEAVATIFRGPRSFTGEDTVELSVHGSKWIQRQVVGRLVRLGAVPASPGEFSQRAFMNGRMDLAQAEAVADLIASSSRAAHRLAINQMTGGFSKRLSQLRDNLVDLASLLELELDFSEEDVEFADREKLRQITEETLHHISELADTYAAGKAFKEGVPVAIAGKPNAGKSTLLNRLLGEDKAIVSDIPGTTRDIIEDTCEIDGILFRFFDTAGLRETTDTIEKIGIDRAHDAIGKASIILWLLPLDDNMCNKMHICNEYSELKKGIESHPEATNIILLTKSDLIPGGGSDTDYKAIRISAKTGEGIDQLKKQLSNAAKREHDPDAQLIITNARHHAELQNGAEALRRVREALEAGLSADLIAQDVRQALHHLGLLTGAVTTDTLLTTIFSRFCIGK